MKEDGLSPVMMEWFLDFHHIFVPRNLGERTHQEVRDDLALSQYMGVIDPNGYVHQMRTGDHTIVQQVLVPLLKEEYASFGGKRYIFGAETDTQEVYRRVFEQAFEKNAQEVVQTAKNLFPELGSPYSKWKEVIYIRTPEVGVAIFGNTILKVSASIYIVFKLVEFTRFAYKKSGIWANQAHRYLTKGVPPPVTEAYRNAHKLHRWFKKNSLKLFIYGWIAQAFFSKIPHPLAQRVSKAVNPSFFLGSGGSYLGILISLVSSTITFGWNMSGRISSTLQYTAGRAKQERLSAQKQHCYSLWNKALESAAR